MRCQRGVSYLRVSVSLQLHRPWGSRGLRGRLRGGVLLQEWVLEGRERELRAGWSVCWRFVRRWSYSFYLLPISVNCWTYASPKSLIKAARVCLLLLIHGANCSSSDYQKAISSLFNQVEFINTYFVWILVSEQDQKLYCVYVDVTWSVRHALFLISRAYCGQMQSIQLGTKNTL